ncbi:hypothetical protein, partial [Actinomadura rupiterrae]|uniref:hypothetical protein n=1 Tax=Actinomadura rupiterrae TaxID=559627 RepID=UPI002646E27F
SAEVAVPSAPPAVPQRPAVPQPPAVPERPGVPERAATPEPPAVPERPAAPERAAPPAKDATGPQPPIVNVNVHVPPMTPPAPPPPAPHPHPSVPPPAPRPGGLDNTTHALHLILTLVTCGLWIPVWIVHAVVASNRTPPLPPAPPQPWQQPLSADQANRAAVQHMNARAQRRREARALAADNPLMARELRLGRTDLPPAQRPYDDGGLIDVNAVPALELTRFGLTPEQAEKAVELRGETGGFSSGEDMAVVCDLPPRLVPELVEYGLYLR